MKSICAWCGADIHVSESDGPDAQTSHGICSGCANSFSLYDGVSLQTFIDSIAVPVLVVDNNTGIVGANGKACEELARKPDHLLDQVIGPVFDCAHSRLPQGCGRSIHCSGCVIRKSVLTTFNTGEAQISVPATLTSVGPDRPSEICLTVTTVKSAGLVVLRLEHLRKHFSA